MQKLILFFIAAVSITSCSLFGIQSEEKPTYKVLLKEDQYEIRSYPPALIAKVTVDGPYKDARSKAFKILAGYIFGKNKGENSISMTSPVEIKKESTKIAMTSPVEIKKESNKYTMAFFMPKKYTLETLPKAIDTRIIFEMSNPKIVASLQYSGSNTKAMSEEKSLELRDWINKIPEYKSTKGYSFLGYNPPWTLPFMRRNEVHILVNKK